VKSRVIRREGAELKIPVSVPGWRRPGHLGMGLLLLALFFVLIAGCYGVLLTLGIVGKKVQSPIITTRVNATVNYAGCKVIVQDVKQAQNFLDDPQSLSNGMVRVRLLIYNKTGVTQTFPYPEITHIVLPGGNEVGLLYSSNNLSVASHTMQTSNIDFPVSSAISVQQLVLRLGAKDEAVIDIALNGHADVSKYMPNTVQVGQQQTYFGLDWTVVRVTSQLGIDGKQAPRNMRYITVILSVDNTLSQKVIPGSPYMYIHLGTGTAQVSPQDITLPVAFNAGVRNINGIATFLVTQKSSLFALILSSNNSNDGFQATSIEFQI
jgi:hypothetical protein